MAQRSANVRFDHDEGEGNHEEAKRVTEIANMIEQEDRLGMTLIRAICERMPYGFGGMTWSAWQEHMTDTMTIKIDRQRNPVAKAATYFYSIPMQDIWRAGEPEATHMLASGWAQDIVTLISAAERDARGGKYNDNGWYEAGGNRRTPKLDLNPETARMNAERIAIESIRRAMSGDDSTVPK